MGRLISRGIAGLLLALVVLPGSTWAYVPDLPELYNEVARRGTGLSRAIIETSSIVFDPFTAAREGPAAAGEGGEPPPVPLPERAFKQKIYWIPQTFLGIETLSEDGKPLHFYLDEGVAPVQEDLTPTRHFSAMDVLPPFLAFVQSDPAEWRRALTAWGIAPRTVSLARGQKDEFYYRLDAGEGQALWLEQAPLRPVKLEARIAGESEPTRLTIEFDDFLTVVHGRGGRPDITYPRTVNYLVNGRLFKQTRLIDFKADPPVRIFPVTAMRNKAKALLEASPPDLDSQPVNP